MAPKIHLYLGNGACSFAAHIALYDANIPFTTTALSVREGFPADKLHLNPKGAVPILILDDETITEVPAILTAISQLVPEKHLLGRTNLEIVRAYEWFNFLSGKVHGQAFGGLFRPGRFVTTDALHDDVRRKAVATINECFTAIDKKLEGREWAVGQEYTAVDAYLLVFYRWGKPSGVAVEKFSNYTRLAKAVAAREAAVKAAEAEGINVLID